MKRKDLIAQLEALRLVVTHDNFSNLITVQRKISNLTYTEPLHKTVSVLYPNAAHGIYRMNYGWETLTFLFAEK